MRVIYCDFNMFNLNAQVLVVNTETNESWPLFTGTFEEVCDYMATEYQTHNYEKIILTGPYAEAVQDRILTYSKINYNFDQINIEVIK